MFLIDAIKKKQKKTINVLNENIFFCHFLHSQSVQN